MLAEEAFAAVCETGLPPAISAAAVSHQAGVRLSAGGRSADRSHGVYRKSLWRPGSEGCRRQGRQADLPRNVEREPGGDSSGRPCRARRKGRGRVCGKLPAGRRSVLHESGICHSHCRRRDRAVHLRREGEVRQRRDAASALSPTSRDRSPTACGFFEQSGAQLVTAGEGVTGARHPNTLLRVSGEEFSEGSPKSFRPKRSARPPCWSSHDTSARRRL